MWQFESFEMFISLCYNKNFTFFQKRPRDKQKFDSDEKAVNLITSV